ncbi:MAG TPA: prohibitin family protein [Parachlamydiaceae bacterium]|nr:prohibitin family protein [Parachlamydiaceae bacterium]
MKSSKHYLSVLSAAFLFILIFCWLFFFKMISPGYVGVVVDLFGDAKGVETKELHVGVHWIAPWKTVYQFPIFEQNHTWEKKEAFNFQTSEGLAISADIGITFHIRPNSIPNIFAKYRRGMDEITHTFIRNYVRDAINKSASKMKIEDLYGESKEIFFDQVQYQVREELRGVGFEISRIYLIGRFHFPETVVAALNQKIEAIQRAQQRENELREAEAEAKKQVAKASGQAQCVILQADSEAKANTVLSQSVTAELIQWQAVQKWDGKLPSVTSGATPFIQIK